MRTSAAPTTAIGRAHRLLDRKTGSEEEQDTMMILAVEREIGFRSTGDGEGRLRTKPDIA